MESASATVTKMSPLTPIAWASASFEKGEAGLSIVVRTSVAPAYRLSDEGPEWVVAQFALSRTPASHETATRAAASASSSVENSRPE